MPAEKKRQKVHVDILVTDLEILDQIAADLDLNRSDVIRIAVRRYIRETV